MCFLHICVMYKKIFFHEHYIWGRSSQMLCVACKDVSCISNINCYGLKCSPEHKCGGPKYGQGIGSVGYQDAIPKLFAVLDFAA